MANADATVVIVLRELSLPNRRQHRGSNQNNSVLFGYESESILSQAADSVILDSTDRWINLAQSVIESSVDSAWILNLSNPRNDDFRGHGKPR